MQRHVGLVYPKNNYFEDDVKPFDGTHLVEKGFERLLFAFQCMIGAIPGRMEKAPKFLNRLHL